MCTCNGINDSSEDVWGFDELLEYVGLGGEGVPVVQHLVQQLVNNNIVLLKQILVNPQVNEKLAVYF